MSVRRPAAPARLIASKFMPVLQLPPVTCAPRSGSLYFGSFEERTTAMSFQDASSSSATSCAMVAGNVLAHVSLADGHRDLAVVADRGPNGRLESRGTGSCQRFADLRERRIAEDETRGGGPDDEASPIEIRQHV